MIACDARHPRHPEIVCVEWSHHGERHHLGYRPLAGYVPQNEVRWPVAYELTLRPRCKRCSMRWGHKDFCSLPPEVSGRVNGDGYWTFDAMEEEEVL